jgi:starvation-inducible DNA-binding protein
MSNHKNPPAKSRSPKFTVPGLDTKDARQMTPVLQERLESLIDLSLTLKHIHWNVVGPTFIGVHTMLDPQVDGVTAMIDRVAERMATLGSPPNGLAGNLVKNRAWDDYSLGRGLVPEHLAALDLVFCGVIEDHRRAIDKMSSFDPVTEDMLIQQTAELEQYQWFVRAHLESALGVLSSKGAQTELEAAELASSTDKRKAISRS